MNIKEANINNLTSLWEEAAKPYGAFYSGANFNHCFIENSDWPNRLWFNQPITSEIIATVKEQLLTTPVPLTVALWDLTENETTSDLESYGFTKLFEQIGMSLKLTSPVTTHGNVNLQLVVCNEDAYLWTKLFKRSFGYNILPDTVIKTMNTFDYYIAYAQNNAVGTAVAYKTNNIVGVHSVGIPPEMRRKGYAKEIMLQLINNALEKGCDYMTLQASNMGKNLYVNLGFNEQFVINNYRLSEQ